MDRLKDKVALITGAARGQGREMAELFMKEGAKAVISTDVLDAKDAEKSPVTFLKQDVTKADQWKAAVNKIVEKHGKIDVLVDNAAICLYEPILETTEAMWDKVLDIDLKSIFFGVREVLPAYDQAQAGFDHQSGVDLTSRRGAQRSRLSGGQGRHSEYQQECRGSYSVVCWYGPLPIGPLIQLGGAS
jgi:NAD(P)-dependent dehydrogenase (short-subunit alcohol dehydrogenase family)